jgi:hypothetical protein
MGIRVGQDVVTKRRMSAPAEKQTQVVQAVANHFRTITAKCGTYVSDEQRGNTIFNIMLKVFRKLPRTGQPFYKQTTFTTTTHL